MNARSLVAAGGAALLLAFAGFNCGKQTCGVTGQSVPCVCASGSGAQVCLADGTYGECQCGGSGGGAATGGGTGGGSAGGTGGGTGGSSGGGTGGSGGGNPLPPTLGTVIDRAGLPFTALLTVGFHETNTSAADQLRDSFNSDAPPLAVATEIKSSLGMLDGIDNSCGNAVLFDATTGYQPLVTLLVADELSVRVVAPTAGCDAYLAIERGVAGACGGREPGVDWYDRVLSGFLLGQPLNLDHVDADPDGVPSATFPYLKP